MKVSSAEKTAAKTAKNELARCLAALQERGQDTFSGRFATGELVWQGGGSSLLAAMGDRNEHLLASDRGGHEVGEERPAPRSLAGSQERCQDRLAGDVIEGEHGPADTLPGFLARTDRVWGDNDTRGLTPMAGCF